MLRHHCKVFHGWYDQFRLNVIDSLQKLFYRRGQLRGQKVGRRLERAVLVTEAAVDTGLQPLLAIFCVRGPWCGLEAKRSEGLEQLIFGFALLPHRVSLMWLFRGTAGGPWQGLTARLAGGGCRRNTRLAVDGQCLRRPLERLRFRLCLVATLSLT
jgi:hypothetical protein